jgi:hypothetical protein
MKTIIKGVMIIVFVLLFLNIDIFVYTVSPSSDEQINAPRETWKKGDWWIIRQKQRAVWRGEKNPPWIDAGRLKFTVKEVKKIQGRKRYFVEVVNLDLPKSAKKKWELDLVYSDYFALIDGKYSVRNASFPIKDALKYIPLRTGGLNAAPIRLEKIKKIPGLGTGSIQKFMDLRADEEIFFHRIDMEIPESVRKMNLKDIQEYQLWLPKEPWWRLYERSYGLPVKAEMVDCSYWHKSQ